MHGDKRHISFENCSKFQFETRARYVNPLVLILSYKTNLFCDLSFRYCFTFFSCFIQSSVNHCIFFPSETNVIVDSLFISIGFVTFLSIRNASFWLHPVHPDRMQPLELKEKIRSASAAQDWRPTVRCRRLRDRRPLLQRCPATRADSSPNCWRATAGSAPLPDATPGR